MRSESTSLTNLIVILFFSDFCNQTPKLTTTTIPCAPPSHSGAKQYSLPKWQWTGGRGLLFRSSWPGLELQQRITHSRRNSIWFFKFKQNLGRSAIEVVSTCLLPQWRWWLCNSYTTSHHPSFSSRLSRRGARSLQWKGFLTYWVWKWLKVESSKKRNS